MNPSKNHIPKILVWIKELRAPFFTATIIPVLLGTIIAWYENGSFNTSFFVLTLAAALFLDGGTNMMNDYFDYKSGCDLHPQYKEFTAPFFGGSRLLPTGILKPREVFIAATLSFALGGTIGFFLAFEVGWIVILLGGIGVITGYLYTKLSSRGVGEFLVFLNAGPLVVIGSYYVQAGTITVAPIIASLPIGFFIANVLWINEIPDYNADKSAEKNTLVVRLGKKRAADTYAILMIIPYILIVLGVASKMLPTLSLIALATLPLTAYSIETARRNYQETPKLVPACIFTVLIHLSTGILLVLGYILANFANL